MAQWKDIISGKPGAFDDTKVQHQDERVRMMFRTSKRACSTLLCPASCAVHHTLGVACHSVCVMRYRVPMHRCRMYRTVHWSRLLHGSIGKFAVSNALQLRPKCYTPIPPGPRSAEALHQTQAQRSQPAAGKPILPPSSSATRALTRLLLPLPILMLVASKSVPVKPVGPIHGIQARMRWRRS